MSVTTAFLSFDVLLKLFQLVDEVLINDFGVVVGVSELLDPVVLEDLLQSQPFFLWHEDLLNEVFDFIRHAFETLVFKVVLNSLDERNDFFFRVAVERRAASEHDVQEDPGGPDVSRVRVVSLDDLWRHVMLSANFRSHSHELVAVVVVLRFVELSRESEINQLQSRPFFFRFEHEVLRLQITVSYFVSVSVYQGFYYLAKNTRSLVLSQMVLVCDVVKQLSS